MIERTPEALARDASLGYQINYLGRLLAHALHRRIAPVGVVPGQFAQMLTLFERDGLTQRELCELVKIEQPTMANTLQRMERDNLIRRESDPADGRRTRVMLTTRARDLEDHLITAARDVSAIATRGLSDHEVSAFMSALTQIINNLEAANHRPEPKPIATIAAASAGAPPVTTRHSGPDDTEQP